MRQTFSRSHEPAIRAPKVVLVLIGFFILAHLARMASPVADEWLLTYFAFFTFRGEIGSSPALLLANGWSPVSYAFLHADWGHLAINSFWILAFGSAVAQRLGTMRFLMLSALCAAAGAAAHWLTDMSGHSVLIGASAAISGQMAAAVRLIYAGGANLGGDTLLVRPLSLRELAHNRQAMVFLAMWAGLNVLFGAGGIMGGDMNIAWVAHFGGFFAGLLTFGWFDRR